MSVQVPYLLQETTIEAERLLRSGGLHWKLSGNPTQHSIVQSQSPEPGATVEAGAVIDLYVIQVSAPGPRPIDDDDIPGVYNVQSVDGFREP